MNAHVAAPEHAVTHGFRPALNRIAAKRSGHRSAMLWFVAAWMFVRRLTGQLQQPLGFLPLMIRGRRPRFTLRLRCGSVGGPWHRIRPEVLDLVAFLVPASRADSVGRSRFDDGNIDIGVVLFLESVDRLRSDVVVLRVATSVDSVPRRC